jgi:hypothetical protein
MCNVFVEEERKPAPVRHLLRQRLAASDAYPVIGLMFRVYDRFPKAGWKERWILNYPLMGVATTNSETVVRIIDHFWAEAEA